MTAGKVVESSASMRLLQSFMLSFVVFGSLFYHKDTLKTKLFSYDDAASSTLRPGRNLKQLDSVPIVLISNRVDGILTSVGSIVESSHAPVDLLLIGDPKINEKVRQHFGSRLGSFVSMTLEDITDDLVSQGQKPIWTWNEWHSSSSPNWKNNNTIHVADWDDLHTHDHELNHVRFYIPHLSLLKDLEAVYFIDDDILVQKDLSNLMKTTIEKLDSSKGLVTPCNVWQWSEDCHIFEFHSQLETILETPPLYGREPVCKSAEEVQCVPENYEDFLDNVIPQGGKNQLAWNFGFSLFDFENWKELQLTNKYEQVMKESYKMHVFPETSLAFGLGVAYIAFAGAVECWAEDSFKVRDGFGFIDWERYQATFGGDFFSSVDVVHYTGPKKPFAPYSTIEAVSMQPWLDMMEHENLTVPSQLPEEPTKNVFSILTSHDSGSEMLMQLLDQHPQLCASGEGSRPETGFPTESLTFYGAPWHPQCSVKIGCTFRFIRDNVRELTADMVSKDEVPPRCAANYDAGDDDLVDHLERLCKFISQLGGDYTVEAIIRLWVDAFVEEDHDLLGCGCPRGSYMKGMSIKADDIASGLYLSPSIPNLHETQFRGSKVIRLKRQNLWARYKLYLTHANNEGKLHVATNEMLSHLRWMQKIDKSGDEWAEKHGSEVLNVEYDDLLNDPSAILEDVANFLGVDSSKYELTKKDYSLLPTNADVDDTFDDIENKDEVVEALLSNGMGKDAGLGEEYNEIQLLVYETDPIRKSRSIDLVRHASQLAGINVVVFGQDQEFAGYGSKYSAVIPKLKNIPAKSLVVLLDGRDVHLNVHSSKEHLYSALADFRKKYHDYTHDHPGAVIVSAESECCVTALSRAAPGDFFNDDGSRNKHTCAFDNPGCTWGGDDKAFPWKDLQEMRADDEMGEGHGVQDIYLNAGLMAGMAGDLMELVKKASIDEYEDDQAVLTDFMIHNPNSIVLDYRQEMFGSNRFSRGMSDGGCMFVSDKANEAGQRLVHPETKTRPLFLHSYGDFFECHDAIAKALGIKTREWLGSERRLAIEQSRPEPQNEDFVGVNLDQAGQRTLKGGGGVPGGRLDNTRLFSHKLQYAGYSRAGSDRALDGKELPGGALVNTHIFSHKLQYTGYSRAGSDRALAGQELSHPIHSAVESPITDIGGRKLNPAFDGTSKAGIGEYSDHYLDAGNLMLLKWDANGTLAINQMEDTISSLYDHFRKGLFANVLKYVNHTKPSPRGRVALLLNSDVTHLLDWNRTPPVPVLSYSQPQIAANKHNFLLLPNPYDASNLNEDCVNNASSVTLSFGEKINKVMWRGSLHGDDPEPARLKVLEMATNESTNTWLDAKESKNSFRTIQEMAHYRYQLELYGVSGTTWGGLRWKMCGGMLVFKVDSPTKAKDWWHDELVPWKHYVPIRQDLSDLYEKWIWAENNPNAAKSIAETGSEQCLVSMKKENVAARFQSVLNSIPEATEEQILETNAILDGFVDAVKLVGL